MNTNIVKTDTKNENDELVIEVQRFVANINNLMQHRREPQFYVDLMNPDVVERCGRERLEKAVLRFLRGTRQASPELSEKFTKLWHEFNRLYFSGNRSMHNFSVEIINEIASDRRFKSGTRSVIEIPVSSEAVMVDRLLGEMVKFVADNATYEAEKNESNRLFFEGAPVLWKPDMRHFPAEEFIAYATRKPMTPEQWREKQMELLEGDPELN
jgi:hypothetical protein